MATRRMFLSTALLLAIFAVAIGSPSVSRLPQPPTKPKDGEIFEIWNSDELDNNLGSDMVLSEAQIRSGIIGEQYRWRNGFFVQIDRRFSDQEYNVINAALWNLHSNMCIDVLLWPRDSNPSGDYVFIKRGEAGTGCWSHVGKRGGRQELNIQTPGCNSVGTVMHEAIHALGFHHEQSRPDRDNHVRVHLQNVQPGKEHNFNKYSTGQVDTFGVPYDLNSVMHYSSHAFSKNGQPTITANNGAQVGSLGVLRNSDIAKLKAMYRC